MRTCKSTCTAQGLFVGRLISLSTAHRLKQAYVRFRSYSRTIHARTPQKERNTISKSVDGSTQGSIRKVAIWLNRGSIRGKVSQTNILIPISRIEVFYSDNIHPSVNSSIGPFTTVLELDISAIVHEEYMTRENILKYYRLTILTHSSEIGTNT